LLNIQAAFQKWVDMSISGNVYYNPEHYPKEKIPDTKVIKEIFHAYKMGIKTLYYNTNYDQDDQTIKEDTSQGNCDSGACAI
jgi:ribonucleoside-diphosphate reductase alpha chain